MMNAGKAKHRWRIQLIRIYEREMRDRLAGVPQAACPYKPGGGNVQRQRRLYWLDGWNKALETP